MKHLPPVRLYDLTLAMRGYTPQSNAWSAEAHYTTAIPGRIHQNREQLRDFAIPHFQEVMRRHYGMYIPRGEIKGQFQQEQPALSPSRTLHVEVFETVYRGRQRYDHHVASEDLPYSSSNENGEEMTPEEEAEKERRLLRGHVPGYDLPAKTGEENDHGNMTMSQKTMTTISRKSQTKTSTMTLTWTILTKTQKRTRVSQMKITSTMLPQIDTLKIDRDCVVSSKWLQDYVRTVIIPICQAHGVKVLSVKYSLSRRKGFHLRIHITPSVHANLANRLQFLLGDDAERVSKNRARIRVGLPNWNKLFEKEHVRFRTLY